jgi:hypothetical protein
MTPRETRTPKKNHPKKDTSEIGMLPAHLKDLKGVFISQVSLYYKTDKE